MFAGPEEKARAVQGVFGSVAGKYDLMNDLMSFGLHRLWKCEAVFLGDYRPGQCVLDLAGGSGDMTRLIAPLVQPGGSVCLADASPEMLERGRARTGGIAGVRAVECNAEDMPFPAGSFDRLIVAFGLRNFHDQPRALAEAFRVLRPCGRLQVLEFSKVAWPLEPAYKCYLDSVLPWLGRTVAGDEASYRYLADSIKEHPDQRRLAGMIAAAGFADVDWLSLSAGIVALHRARKLP